MNPGATSTCVSKLPASPELLAGEKLRAAHNFRCRTVRPEPPTGAADLGGIKDVDDYITKAMRSMARDPAYDFSGRRPSSGRRSTRSTIPSVQSAS